MALHHPQNAVEVRLAGEPDGPSVDVTHLAVVATLQPLTLAIGLEGDARTALGEVSRPTLRFIDRESQCVVGSLTLARLRDGRPRADPVVLFEVAAAAQCCVGWPYRPWNRYLQNRTIRGQRHRPNNFWMPPEAVQQLMVFYIRPRQVVLVSVEAGEHRNLFPMDLIGPVGGDRFTLALRNTSQSIPAMKLARRVALSDVAAADRARAYQLGSHHREALLDWQALPFRLERSPEFGLPYPESALRVRELEILDFESIGSHTFFMTRIVAEELRADTDQLHHTSGLYQYFRMRQGRPFPLAT